MIRLATFVATLMALAGVATPVSACMLVSLNVVGNDDRRIELPPFRNATDAAIGDGFPGEVILYRGGMNYIMRSCIECETSDWPWASVTKQVVATLVMQEVERGTVALDSPAIAYLRFPPGGDTPSPTLRQLLQHRAGLRNPEDSRADENGIPDFYSTGAHGLDWCLAERRAPPQEGWRYNNCDYIVLGAVLEAVTGKSLRALTNERFRAAAIPTIEIASRHPRPLAPRSEELPVDISRWGASGAMIGSLHDMIAFDRALLDGRLLSAEARETMWEGDPALGYMALGQWAYDVPLKGCDAPVRIIERRGDILAYEVRNFIVPSRDIALAMAVYDDDIEFGELWQRSGKSFDILSAAVCGAGA